MDDKVQLNLGDTRFVEIEYKGHTIKVKPYLSKKEQEELIDLYLKEYHESSFMDAEYFLLFSIIETCTNIELMHNDDESKRVASLHIDDLYSHWELVGMIRTNIRNYAQFYAHLQQILKFVTDKENSLNNAIQIGYTKVLDLLDHLTHTEISDEQIAQVKDLVATIEKSPVLNEATKIFRQETEPKTAGKRSPTPRKQKKTNGRK